MTTKTCTTPEACDQQGCRDPRGCGKPVQLIAPNDIKPYRERMAQIYDNSKRALDDAVLCADQEINELKEEIAWLKQRVESTRQSADSWRRLALQFDEHRMTAMGHLKMLVAYTESCEGMMNANPAGQVLDAKNFLAAGPLSGEVVLAQRIAELAAKTLTDEEAWEVAKDTMGLDLPSWDGGPTVLLENPKEAGELLKAFLTAVAKKGTKP